MSSDFHGEKVMTFIIKKKATKKTPQHKNELEETRQIGGGN